MQSIIRVMQLPTNLKIQYIMMVSGLVFINTLVQGWLILCLGASYNRGVLTKELETGYKDDISTSYDHTNFNVKVGMSCLVNMFT